jgi:transcriptional regulator with XRE-family HTH domain
MTFGEHIRQWREERRGGLRQFAKAIGVSATFISKMERGEGPLPGEKTIRKMAVYFGKNPDELLAMADKVAADVLAIIIKQPAYARFIRENAHLTKEQLEALARLFRAPQDQNDAA